MDEYIPFQWHPYSDFHRERVRAHEKHEANGQSMESKAWDDAAWLKVVAEEFGEVAHALTYDSGASVADLREELVQLGAMTAAWVDAVDAADRPVRSAGFEFARQLRPLTEERDALKAELARAETWKSETLMPVSEVAPELEALRAQLSTQAEELERAKAEVARLRIAYSDCREARDQYMWLEHGVLRTPPEVAVNEANKESRSD
jgi:chromosome segregation ATPase